MPPKKRKTDVSQNNSNSNSNSEINVVEDVKNLDGVTDALDLGEGKIVAWTRFGGDMKYDIDPDEWITWLTAFKILKEKHKLTHNFVIRSCTPSIIVDDIEGSPLADALGFGDDGLNYTQLIWIIITEL